MRKDLIHCVSGFSMSCLCCVFTNVDLQVNGSGVYCTSCSGTARGDGVLVLSEHPVNDSFELEFPARAERFHVPPNPNTASPPGDFGKEQDLEGEAGYLEKSAMGALEQLLGPVPSSAPRGAVRAAPTVSASLGSAVFAAPFAHQPAACFLLSECSWHALLAGFGGDNAVLFPAEKSRVAVGSYGQIMVCGMLGEPWQRAAARFLVAMRAGRGLYGHQSSET
ncbi:hypothetical protein Anapl_14970 [Anas platyrhynchos]|uniref:Uncharacterized protein n=1 Tax=Anas platyrhynchos TaxID=8839 RepID=R0LKU4_ANAPL|nr:hypothetical protein Anapl_14970 [Anas platyrhynchos]